jgi:hypothetical protein
MPGWVIKVYDPKLNHLDPDETAIWIQRELGLIHYLKNQGFRLAEFHPQFIPLLQYGVVVQRKIEGPDYLTYTRGGRLSPEEQKVISLFDRRIEQTNADLLDASARSGGILAAFLIEDPFSWHLTEYVALDRAANNIRVDHPGVEPILIDW